MIRHSKVARKMGFEYIRKVLQTFFSKVKENMSTLIQMI